MAKAKTGPRHTNSTPEPLFFSGPISWKGSGSWSQSLIGIFQEAGAEMNWWKWVALSLRYWLYLKTLLRKLWAFVKVLLWPLTSMDSLWKQLIGEMGGWAENTGHHDVNHRGPSSCTLHNGGFSSAGTASNSPPHDGQVRGLRPGTITRSGCLVVICRKLYQPILQMRKFSLRESGNVSEITQ